jgi:GNAT superfamily N-acetyltransferase
MKIQEISTAHLKDVNKLVSVAFGYAGKNLFFHDFPVWNSTLPNVKRLGIFEGQKLVSHVGIRYCEMKTPTGVVSVALVGAVATDENFRGKGFSTALLKEALTQIDARGCEWSLLWGSEHEFYGKLGFKLQGKQGRARVSKFSVGPKMNLVPEVNVGMTEEIFQALLKEPVGVKLRESDRAWIFEHKTIQWLWLKEPFAFVGYERGMDLKHIVHEFGGSLDGIQRLLYPVYAHDPMVEVLGKPEALEKIGFESGDIIREFLCLARPLSEAQIWDDSFWVSGVSAC